MRILELLSDKPPTASVVVHFVCHCTTFRLTYNLCSFLVRGTTSVQRSVASAERRFVREIVAARPGMSGHV